MSSGADLHASAVAELGVAALRAPVRAVVVLDRSGASGDLSYVVDVNGEGVAAPLKLAGLLRQRSGAAAHELTARWRDLQVAEVASLLRDRSRFDARAGLVNLDASVSGALGAPAVGVTVDVSDLAATAGTVTITGTGALSFLYSGGALASRDRGLTLDNLGDLDSNDEGRGQAPPRRACRRRRFPDALVAARTPCGEWGRVYGHGA